MADIFTAIYPMLVVGKFLGLAPFCMDRKKKSFRVSIFGVIYSALVLIAFTSNAAYFMYSKIVFKDERIESYIGLATDVILLSSGIGVTICSILFTLVQRKKYVRVVETFHSVGFEISKINEGVPYENLLRYSVIQLVVLFLVLSLLFLHSLFYITIGSKLLLTSYLCSWFIPKVYNFMMEFQFASGALLLKIHFNLLNNCLEKFEGAEKSGKELNKTLDTEINSNAWVDNLDNQKNNKIVAQSFTVWEGQLSKFRTRKIWSSESSMPSGPVFLDKIKLIRKIHSNLCEIKEYLNSSFSLQLLTSVAQAFIFITANLYMIFTTLSTNSEYSVIALSYPIIWSIMHTIELVIIVVTCTNTSKAANYTAVLVHKLLAKDCKPELRNQLKLFSVQLLHRKISFSAAGFFILDMTLLQAIIGAATTYLVILIQFHNTYEMPREV